MQIKNIVFDIGNVLLTYHPHDYLMSKYNRIDSDFLFNAIFNTKEWLELDRGTITEMEALEIFIDRNPERETILIEMMDDFYNVFTPIESSVSMLHQLKKQDYRILYLSNIHTGIYEHVIEKYSFFSLFEGGIISADVKTLKPGREIFHRLLDKYKILPEESLFIDDTEPNILMAEEMGFTVIHLQVPGELENEIKKLGI
ncbi:MAG: HAD family phosphatase [Spirochaetaceae bacterium]|nr:HAD family phosphatase [Spirochaetaceae bacterium]